MYGTNSKKSTVTQNKLSPMNKKILTKDSVEMSKFETSLIETTMHKSGLQGSSVLDNQNSAEFLNSNGQSQFSSVFPDSQRQKIINNANRSVDQNIKRINLAQNSLVKNNTLGDVSLIDELQENSLSKNLDIVNSEGRVRKQKQGKMKKIPLPMARITFDRIIYPVQTKTGLKYPKKALGAPSHVPKDLVNETIKVTKQVGKLLDGFLILFSCRVKLPHEAITSKLDGQNIVEVIEEDLAYFQNLRIIDLSDNQVRLEQLRNLKSVEDINLQYNYIRIIPQLAVDDFERLSVLNLSYNSITPASIRSLYSLNSLKILDLQANNLVTLPEDISQFINLEELNLSSNQFSSSSTLVNPSLLFKALGQIKKLKRLFMSRNKFSLFHSEMLNRDIDFINLQELDFSFNLVQSEEGLWFLTQLRLIQLVTITCNPFALRGQYDNLQAQMRDISAVLINDEIQGERAYLKKVPTFKNMSSYPYPNPIKLLSRGGQNSTEHKGEYLNAELLQKGVALTISDIKPDQNIESEIFPPELTREAQNKEVFTPPNHQQMRFIQNQVQEPFAEDNVPFYITEEVRPEFMGPHQSIQEENESEQDYGPSPQQHKQQEDQEEKELEEDFDFGNAKMEYFKRRAREILMSDNELEYEGAPMPIGGAYKQLKQSIKQIAIQNPTSIAQKPSYMKMTFSQGRQAPDAGKLMDLSSVKNDVSRSIKQLQIGLENGKVNPLLLSLKNEVYRRAGSQNVQKRKDQNKFLQGALGADKIKTKKELERDKKVEAMLEAFKRSEEELLKKEQQREITKKANQQALLGKYGMKL